MAAKHSSRTDKSGKYPALIDPLWVSGKVSSRNTKYSNRKKVMELISSNNFQSDGNDAYLDIVPCGLDEPCCYGKPVDKGINFTVFYENIFADLEYRLPLSDFTCSILTLLNVAPTQLHCTSLAYLKAFELLCHYMGIIPTCNQFLFFYETCAKPVRGGYVSVSTARGRGLFTLFKSNYKHWKEIFFMVKETEKCKDVFYFDDKSHRFPFEILVPV